MIRNALPAIANEMAADLQRTSYNMMIYEVRDFCTSLVDTTGQLISQNVGGVSHFVADLGVIVTDAMKRYGAKGFAPGDVIITNHQAVAGQHLNNIVIYMPYFYKGELLMFAMVRAHWIDVGGMSTGFGAGPSVADPWLEGLQLDQLKIYEAGKAQRDALSRAQGQHPLSGILARRHEIADGGLPARGAAPGRAVRQIRQGHDPRAPSRRSSTRPSASAATSWRSSRTASTRRVRSSTTTASSATSSVPIHAKVTIDHGSMTIDLSGCSGERKAAINSRTYAGARVAYKALTGPLEPVNEGSFRALKVIIPEGNIMMARFPAPMAGWSVIVPTVVDTIIKALGDAMRDRVPAGHHGLLGGSIVFFGVHPKTKRRFVVQSIEGGGWGGRPSEDGESGSVSVCQGDVRNASIEGIELKCPVLVESRGAAHRFRRRRQVSRRPRHRHLRAQSRRGPLEFRSSAARALPALGHLGRQARHATAIFCCGCRARTISARWTRRHYPVPVDSEVIVRTGGGGGWGDPLEREAALVRADVIEELISRRVAGDDYGVVLRDDLTLDEAATAQRRNGLRSGRA